MNILTKKGNEREIKNYKLSKAEQELIMRYDQEDNMTTIYTTIPSQIKKFSKMYKVIDSTNYSKTFECPKNCISFKNPNRKKRELSPEHKQKLINGRNKNDN
jgi:hypothetical protein